MINAITIFVIFIGLIILGAPIAMAIGLGTLAGTILGDFSISSIPLLVSSGSSNASLIAIPYFILLGNIMNMGGIADRIYDFAEACIGHVKGGLAQVNVLGSVIFAGVSGTSSADAAGLGLVEIRSMEKKGYDLAFSASVTMVSSILGPLIPPSVSLLIYGSLTGTSVAELFMGGLLPGILAAITMCITIYYLYVSGKVPMPAPTAFSWKRLWETTRDGIFALLCPVILFLTMTSGVVTTTEAGIVGAVYSIIVALIYKELSWKKLLDACIETVKSCTLIMFLIGMGSALGWVLTAMQIPQAVADFLFALTDNKYILLLLINIVLLILGMFMDSTVIQLLMVPILLPIMDALLISRVHFGVMMTVNILVGTMTPPFGLGLFIVTSITGLTIPQILKAAKPFFVPVIILLLLVTYIPAISTWIPWMLFG